MFYIGDKISIQSLRQNQDPGLSDICKRCICNNQQLVNAPLSLLFWQWCFGPEPSTAPTVCIRQILSCSEICGYIEKGIGWDDLMGTSEGFLRCQSLAILVVFSQRSDTKRVVWETTRCNDSRSTEGTWKCAEDGGVWIAITAHQGNFQRLAKLLKVLHSIDLQLFPLVSSLKSLGGEAAFLCAHRHHRYTINYRFLSTEADFCFTFLELIETFISNPETFQPVQHTVHIWCTVYRLLLREGVVESTEITKTSQKSVSVVLPLIFMLTTGIENMILLLI